MDLLTPAPTFTETATPGTYTANLDISTLADGSYTVEVTVTDTRGVSGSDSATFTIGPAPTALDVLVEVDRGEGATYFNRETVIITVTVTDGTSAVPGASVHVLIITPDPKLDFVADGTTDENGLFVVNFKVNAKRDGTGRYDVVATATKDGFDPGSDMTFFFVQ